MGHYNLKRDKIDERDLMFSSVFSPGAVLPLSVDFRSQCPEVYDQGQLGSCTANAGCTALALALKNKDLKLSRLFMYYEERKKEGTINEDAGAAMRDICKVAAKGICREQFMPYDIRKFAIAPTAEAYADSASYKATAYHSVRGVNQIKQALAIRNCPVLIGIQVFEQFESPEMARTGRMQMPQPGEVSLGGHAVLIVGYVDEGKSGYFIVRNSWGLSWGDHGYFYMPYEFVTKGYAFDSWMLS